MATNGSNGTYVPRLKVLFVEAWFPVYSSHMLVATAFPVWALLFGHPVQVFGDGEAHAHARIDGTQAAQIPV